ncbi:hypothetical protein ACFVWG_14785 [Kribbella sp. NPDC058245]|uniref:hypothetical protein n=1 Tax=Kribbella sp. NPDC058245 TaxID=3346399 RepID=UPI0036EED9D2
MRPGNGRLAIGLTAIAVLAVAGGAAFAADRGPTTSPSTAALPLAPTPSGDAVPTVSVNLAELPTGRSPQVAYLSGRVVKGGLGGDITVPGKQAIMGAVRYDGEAMVILEVGVGGSELVQVSESTGIEPGTRIPDVASLVTSVDEDMIAFGTARRNADNTSARGNTVYLRSSFVDEELRRPNDWASTVLAVVGDTVYFAAQTDRDGQTSTLNAWHWKTGKVDLLSSFKSPADVDFQGARGVDQLSGAAQTFCSAIRQLADGKQLWRTCEYSLNGFTPGGGTVFATPDFRGEGGDPSTTAIDSRTGEVLRRWTGVQFLGTVAEDDDHLLMAVDTGENTAGAIIRCSIGSGSCELATSVAKTARRDDLRLLGSRT